MGKNISSKDGPRSYALSGKIMLSAIAVLFTVVIRRASRRRLIFSSDSQAPAANSCLDPSILASLPVLLLSEEENYDEFAECPVCLIEFNEGEKIRCLLRCNHRFHVECIDMWFCLHSTCPLCRDEFGSNQIREFDVNLTYEEENSKSFVSPNGRMKRIIGPWTRGRFLGSGSFGTVHEAMSSDGGFFVVKEVSLLDKGSSAQQCILQLEQEIALLSQFEHENIVQYYGTDKEESKLFIFLELVTQGSLASLYQNYQLQNTQVSAYTRQILNGLQYLHERNVVHRDIKCANILVQANGSVKLADFGLAKQMSNLNDLKSCKGSVYWMAPEVINPQKTYGYAADIWSLGCTVLEMLTSQIPYPNVEWQHAFYKIGRGDQPPIPCHLSKEAQDFIRQCVQVDPNCRPTAAQLLEHPFIRRPVKI